MIVTPYFAKLTGIEFRKICLSPPSRCRGVLALSFYGTIIFKCLRLLLGMEWLMVKSVYYTDPKLFMNFFIVWESPKIYLKSLKTKMG